MRKITTRPIGIFLILLLFSSNIQAQEKTLLSDLIKKARERNPDISSMRNKVLADKETVSYSHWWDDPVIGTEYWQSGRSSWMFTISQTIPFPGKTSARKNIAEKEAEISGTLLRARTLALISEVKKSYYMYYLAYKKIDLVKENIDLLRQISANLNTLYIANKVPQSDVLKAETETARMNSMLFMLESDKRSSEAMLTALLNYTNDDWMGEPELREDDTRTNELTGLRYDQAPDIKAKELSVRKSAYNLRLAKLEWLPDFMVGTKIDTTGQVGFMASIAVPLSIFRHSALVKRMKYEYRMSASALQDTRNMYLARVKDLLNQYTAKVETLKDYKSSILPLSEQTLKLSLTGFTAGKNTFLDLLDSQTRYLQSHMEYYDTLVQSRLILAEIEKLVGQEIN